jgi:hypothetical protein
MSLVVVWAGYAIYPYPSSEPRLKTDSVEGQPRWFQQDSC